VFLAAVLAGCSGQVTITVPDAVAASPADAPVAVRLQQQEFWKLQVPVEGALLRMSVVPDNTRAAYTRADGYASAAVPAPAEPGRYVLTVMLQDHRGDEACQTGTCYVLDPNRLAVVIDWEAIEDDDQARQAAEPLARLARAGVQIVYAATGTDPCQAHRFLADQGLPDGPVLSWGTKSNWRGKHLQVTGSLPTARSQLPALLIAAGPEDDFLRAAEQLNIVAISIGAGREREYIEVPDFAAFADRLLAAEGLLGEKDFKTVSTDAVGDAMRRSSK